MSDKDLDFIGDEFWGIGGRYVVNPATGKRERAPVVEEAIDPVAAQIGQRPDDAAPGTQADFDSHGLAPAKTLKE